MIASLLPQLIADTAGRIAVGLLLKATKMAQHIPHISH